MSVFTNTALVTGSVFADIPQPIAGTPPGANGLLTILGWISWIVFAIAVAGVLIVAGKMMFDHRQGNGGGQAATGLIWVLSGCIIAAVASGLVGAVVTASGGTA
jgi:hypothetical protein